MLPFQQIHEGFYQNLLLDVNQIHPRPTFYHTYFILHENWWTVETWFQRLFNLPADKEKSPTVLSLGGKLYVGGGADTDGQVHLWMWILCVQCQPITALSRVYLINGTFSTRPRTACFSWRMVALGSSIILHSIFNILLMFSFFLILLFQGLSTVPRSWWSGTLTLLFCSPPTGDLPAHRESLGHISLFFGCWNKI